MFGGLIVRGPKSKSNVGNLYDRDEHVVIINEWTRASGGHGYVLEYQNDHIHDPHTILVNGHGRTPPATFVVDKVITMNYFFLYYIGKF